MGVTVPILISMYSVHMLCKCPTAVLKYSCEDTKEVHKYILSANKVVSYAVNTFTEDVCS